MSKTNKNSLKFCKFFSLPTSRPKLHTNKRHIEPKIDLSSMWTHTQNNILNVIYTDFSNFYLSMYKNQHPPTHFVPSITSTLSFFFSHFCKCEWIYFSKYCMRRANSIENVLSLGKMNGLEIVSAKLIDFHVRWWLILPTFVSMNVITSNVLHTIYHKRGLIN